MIRRTILTNSSLEVSRLSLGLSRIHHLRSARARSYLIQSAQALGMTHFDTASMYGDGLSETSLGRALQQSGTRSAVTITTKFGLLPWQWLGKLGAAGTPLRAGRAVGHRAGLVTWPRRAYDGQHMRQSLNGSLRRLRTDHIDIFCIHDPRPAEVDLDALIGELNVERQAGKIRLVGVAGEHAQQIAATHPGGVDVVQTPEAAWRAVDPLPDFTYGVFQAPISDTPTVPRLAGLERALRRRENGSIVIGTLSLDHLRQSAALAAEVEGS